MVNVFSLERGLTRGFLRPLGSSAGSERAGRKRGGGRGAGHTGSDSVIMACGGHLGLPPVTLVAPPALSRATAPGAAVPMAS